MRRIRRNRGRLFAAERTEERCFGHTIGPERNHLGEIRVQTSLDEKPKNDWREVCRALAVCAAYLLFTTFAFALYKSKSLFVPIFIHAIMDYLGVIAQTNGFPRKRERGRDSSFPIPLGPLSREGPMIECVCAPRSTQPTKHRAHPA